MNVRISKTKANVKISRNPRGESGPTKFYKVIALSCVTVDENHTPFFFLFSDIDDKDQYHLSRILKFFAVNHLSFYWYESAKGYHVISPCLLNIEEWYRLRRGLKLIENGYYEGLNVRISKKTNDPKNRELHYERKYLKNFKESLDCKILVCSMSLKMLSYLLPGEIRTRLNFSKYNEIEINGVKY